MKYKNEWTTYNGVKYQSKKEANYAMSLDWRIKAGEVIKWVRQHPIELVVHDHLIATYFLDFKVWLSDGRIQLVEVKGFKTEVWKIKWKLIKALNPEPECELILI